MFPEIAQLADSVAVECGTVWTCDPQDLTCSESPEMCVASGSFTQHIDHVSRGTCPVIAVHGAGVFDMEYTLAGSVNGELIFKGVHSTRNSFVLQSVTVDICTPIDMSLSFGGMNIDPIIGHSASGYLLWEDTSQVDTLHSPNQAGCKRHLWSLQDTTGSIRYMFITVDPSEHPRYISSEWVEVWSTGEILQSELELSCSLTFDGDSSSWAA